MAACTLSETFARSEADAPDIDGRVYVRGRLPLGEFAQVKVIGHTDYDLIAEPALLHRRIDAQARPRPTVDVAPTIELGKAVRFECIHR